MSDENGSADEQTGRQQVLEFFMPRAEPATDDELALATGLRSSTASKRRGDLVRDGFLKDTGKRRPTSSGSPAKLWVRTPEGVAAYEAGETTIPDVEVTVEEVMRKRPDGQRRVYALLGEHGRLADMEMRKLMGALGSTARDGLHPLLQAGLVREAGKANNRGRKAQRYEQTPRFVRAIAAEKEKWAGRVKKPGKAKTLAASQLSAMRKMEPGDFNEWARFRRRFLNETVLVTEVEAKVFWECVPEDELEAVMAEAIELRDWAEKLVESLEVRATDDGLRRKIEKMLGNTNGRTEAEIETARGRAAVLKTKIAV